MEIKYPDISDIIARKEQGRRDLANLTFSEKIDRLEALRKRIQPLLDYVISNRTL